MRENTNLKTFAFQNQEGSLERLLGALEFVREFAGCQYKRA